MDIINAECEIIARKILPVLRAKVAQNLSKEYGLQQNEVSKKLGVTQAAVSFYLSKSRGANVSLIRKFPEINATAKEMADALQKGGTQKRMREYLCELCRKIKNKKAFISLMD